MCCITVEPLTELIQLTTEINSPGIILTEPCRERLIREGVCTAETIPSVSSINRVLRNISAKEKVIKRKSKCWEEMREGLTVKREEVTSLPDTAARGESMTMSGIVSE